MSETKEQATSPWLLSWKFVEGGYSAESAIAENGVPLIWRIELSADAIGNFTLEGSDAFLPRPKWSSAAAFHIASEWAERAEKNLRGKQLVVLPEPSIPPSESNGEGARAVVIDGPGEYEVVETCGLFEVGEVVKVEPVTHMPSVAAGLPWAVYSASGVPLAIFRSNGLSELGKNRVRKHAPPSLETKPEPKLEEELQEGWWWCVRCYGERIKVYVHRSKFDDCWIAEHKNDDEGQRTTMAFDDDGSIPVLGQLVRRVQQPTVEPYVTDEDKGRMFGKSVRKTSTGVEYRVYPGINEAALWNNGTYWLSWPEVARDFTFLDGSPIGTLIEDTGT